MEYTQGIARQVGVFALLLPLWSLLSQATLQQTLCSNVNTAPMSSNFSIYQSNGLCRDFCIDKNYAFAVVQWQSCWCSDIAPAKSSTADVSEKCNAICPGFQEESCGSRPDWYGYLALLKSPAGTAAGDDPPAASTTRPPATTDQAVSPEIQTRTETQTETVQNTVTFVPPPPSSITTTTSTTPTKVDQPHTTVQTVTADGTVRTVTVIPTSAGTQGSAEMPSQNQSSGPNTGQIVGIVVGVIGLIVIAAGIGLFLYFSRKKRNQEEENDYDQPSQRGSSAGMMGTPQMVVTMGQDGRVWDPDSNSEQRRSRLMAVDPRLDPQQRAVYMRNKSHESVNTIRDDQDYSRKVHQPVLRATNPDPDDDN